jgi:hypothetical protein
MRFLIDANLPYRFSLNLDAVTNSEDLKIIEANFNRRCPGFRP